MIPAQNMAVDVPAITSLPVDWMTTPPDPMSSGNPVVKFVVVWPPVPNVRSSPPAPVVLSSRRSSIR